MDRIAFLESISGIEYPEMIVEFFDQFLALKQLVENYGNVSVLEKSNNVISFSIAFNNKEYINKALLNIQSGSVIIYGRPISVTIDELSDTEIKISLK